MKKVSILIPHFRTYEWTAICLHQFKKFGFSGIPFELIVADNSPGHPSIRVLTETSLGVGVKIINGDPDFPSHGHGYDLAYEESDGDWIFTSETDSFPTRHGWFEEYIKASADHSLIGPEMPMAAGRYIHPAGALIKASIIDRAAQWQDNHRDWKFVPGAAAALGESDRAYHLVAHLNWLRANSAMTESIWREVRQWEAAGPFQEMRAFEDDTFETYGQRTGIENFEPPGRKLAFRKIGYEAGQWLSYFAESQGEPILRAPVQINWMDGWHGRQALRSTVFGGFQHIWGGTVSQDPNFSEECRRVKEQQRDVWFQQLPEQLREQINKIKATA